MYRRVAGPLSKSEVSPVAGTLQLPLQLVVVVIALAISFESLLVLLTSPLITLVRVPIILPHLLLVH